MDEEELRPIFRAVEGDDVKEVARLLDAKPHLMEAKDPRSVNRTPLIIAAGRAHVGVVRLLLERGADVNAGSTYGTTALHLAAEKGHEEVVPILLSHGADPSRKTNTRGNTPLITASIASHLGVARQLLQVRECGLDERNNRGCTALWWACARGHVETARTLLLAGANHTLADSGQTPRQIAKKRGRIGCLALLQWWEGELERGYVVHRARYLTEQHSLLQPALDAVAAAAAASLASSLASVAIPAFLSPRTRVVPVPHVEVVRLSEDEETGALTGQGERKVEEEEEEEGGDVQGPSEAERDATVKYVMQDLHPELYIELMAGFHPIIIKILQEEVGDALSSSSDSLSDGGDY